MSDATRTDLASISRHVLRLGCTLAALLLWPGPGSASPLLELIGAEEAGFTGRASAAGPRAAYFNPALLLGAEQGPSIGVFVLIERLDVRLDPRGSSASCLGGVCDVPAINGAGPESFRHEDGSSLEQPTLPTAWLQEGRADDDEVSLSPRPRQGAGSGNDEHGYLSLGIAQTALAGRFAYGLTALLPLDGFMRSRAFYGDEREQFFSNSLHHELYVDRVQAAAIALGAAAQPFDALAIGVSLTLGIASAAEAPVYVSNLADLDSLFIDSDVSVGLSLAPHVGMVLTPLEHLRLSATVHSPQGTEIETGFSYVIATGTEQHASQRFELGYLPWQLGLGAELSFGRPQRAWSLAAGAKYAFWSRYRDRHGERPSGSYAWSNVVDVALTARAQLRRTAGFLSALYAPSPVPDQTGRSNYVDSDRIGAALGASYDVPLVGSVALRVALEAQAHRLLERDTRKLDDIDGDPSLVRDEVPDDAIGGTPRGPIEGREGLQTNNPGFPGFESEGLLFGAGARVSLVY